MSTFGRSSTPDALSQHSRGYDTRLPDWEANRSLRNDAVRGKDSTSPDPFQEPKLAQEGDMELQRLADSLKREC